MPLESATYVNQLINTNPADSDQRSTSSAHHRLIKTALLNSFPNIGAAVTATAADLNVVTGLASTPTLVAPIPVGTLALFIQAAAPTGWTLYTTLNDIVIRVTNGTSGGAGGATGGSWAISGVTLTDPGHILTNNELPVHSHGYQYLKAQAGGTNANYTAGSATGYVIGDVQTDNDGGGAAHVHNISFANDSTWRPAYVNAIICTKN